MAVTGEVDLDLDLDPGVPVMSLELGSGSCLPSLPLPALPMPGFPGLPSFDFSFLLDLLNLECPRAKLAKWLG